MTDLAAAFTPIRLAELMAALSIATDLAMAQPLEYAINACVLAVRLGEKLGLSDNQLRDLYYQALLRYIGCNAETDFMASLYGSEMTLRESAAVSDLGRMSELLSLLMRQMRKANEGASMLQMMQIMARGLTSLPEVSKTFFGGHCEVAQRLAQRLGFGQRILHGLGQNYERWDGRGLPNHIKGDQVDELVLLITLAQDATTFFRLEGVDAAVHIARERRGGAYHPGMVDIFCQHASHLFIGLEQPSWEQVLAIEPGPRLYLTEAQFDTACEVFADFADIKSPYVLGHSRGVAVLAAGAARQCGLPDQDVTAIKHAAWMHDVGRVGISAAIWGKPGAFTDKEWEQVRLHPYYTERILARPKALANLGSIACLHHERLDGSGYHRGATAAMLSPAARILAAADYYQRMTEERPHRPAKTPEAAADALRLEVRAGRLDSEAANGVLAAAGHQVRPQRREFVAGLSEREIEVLRLAARGHSTRQIATLLHVAPKTVDNHLQHIYAKIGVTTRAGATLFAMEQNLLTPME